MNTTRHTLKGITDGKGTCDHCGRTLSRLFRIEADGVPMVVGRTCAKNLTGYSWSVAQAERLEALAIRVAIVQAGPNSGLYAELGEAAASHAKTYGVGGAAAEGATALRDGVSGLTSPEVTAFARECLVAA